MNMDDRIIRFGVIGTSEITQVFLKGAKLVEKFKLAAVYSRKEETAREFADKYGVKTIFTSLEEMAKSDEIDAVYIASPNSFHAKQAIIFMKNRKHVLCEKAFASNIKEVEEMILNEEEQEKKRILWEAANGEWLKQQEEKRKEKEKNGAHVTKRKKKQTVRNKNESIMNRIVLNINIL